jgi:modulator of FtsH protease
VARPLRHGGRVAGALIGLLFVAISINLDRIIAGANLPRRALETVAVLVAILTVAVLGLVPQPGWAGGVLILLVGRLRHLGGPIEQRRFRNVPAVVLGAFALPLVAAGLTLILGAGGGLYWLVPAMVLGFGGAVLNAWVLLVEIVR